MPTAKKFAIFLLVLVVISNLIICCGVVYFATKLEYYAQGGGKEKVVSEDEGVYAIDSQTLLQDLRLNKIGVFEYLPDGDLILSPETNLPPVRWAEADYFFVADIFNQHISNESLQNWQYDSMAYGMDCDEIAYGPQWATFSIIKYVSSGDKKIRFEKDLLIYPDENRVGWFETGYEDLYSHPSFTLDQIRISLKDAQQIAEEQGGEGFRLSKNNDCKMIFDIVMAGNRDGNWEVRYRSNGDQYVINIDKETGEYQIVEP